MPFGYVELIEDEGDGVHVAVIDDALGCVGDFVIVRQLPRQEGGPFYVVANDNGDVLFPDVESMVKATQNPTPKTTVEN